MVNTAAARRRAWRQFRRNAVQGIATVRFVEVEAAVLAGVAQHRGQVVAEAVHTPSLSRQ
ncbi:hypothetical protein [Massilia eburnea]|uniref:hypothetical protein n=1 Tax=Massilia eburnea TaxID=1776165 RepID=UPI003D6BB422